jgi:hypothetical protein
LAKQYNKPECVKVLEVWNCIIMTKVTFRV